MIFVCFFSLAEQQDLRKLGKYKCCVTFIVKAAQKKLKDAKKGEEDIFPSLKI